MRKLAYIFGIALFLFGCAYGSQVVQRTPEEIQIVNQIQDSLRIEANNYPKILELPEYNLESYEYVKGLIKKLFETSPQMSSRGMFGTKEEVDDLKHLMGVYLGWGGLKEEYVLYKACLFFTGYITHLICIIWLCM